MGTLIGIGVVSYTTNTDSVSSNLFNDAAWTLNDWVDNGDETYSNFDASTQGPNTYLEQDAGLIQGATYRIEFTIIIRTVGGMSPVVAGTNGSQQNSVNSFTEEIVAGSTSRSGFTANGSVTSELKIGSLGLYYVSGP